MTQDPDWLTSRDASLRLAPGGNAVYVLFSGTPQYKLVPTPAKGGHSCAVFQSVNGRRLDKDGPSYRTREEALHAGLETLRQALGW